MRVSGRSKCGSVAGAIAGCIRDNDEVVLECIGVNAVYSAVKSIMIASNFLKADGIKLMANISKTDKELKDGMATVILFTLSGVHA